MTERAENLAPVPGDQTLPAERLKAFADAVVAIAMTLLILPLMESVGDAAADGLATIEWLNENAGQLFSFALSFLLIANFWLTHHRLFAGIHRVTAGLLWLTIAWMFTIVWLPIATALLGQLEEDAGQKVLYIGTLAMTSLVMLLIRLYVLRHPALHDIPRPRLRSGLVADVVMLALFLLALAVAVLFPAVGYWAMFLLLLVAPLHRLLVRQE
ncbi:TMEM175 family protein [Microbacterium yannicii]|uniref:TMEM175 family protein n=1 Tax=Microbacterium yannicii TaxID=671622 RepID=UPI0018878E65|nr:TMEM175 family protein [Microbacterium yannicii]MCO5951792.1 TMEM175 family protein [Microbacterium yannicii]